MLRLADGRECLYQWDPDPRLRVNEPEGVQIEEVHFANSLTDSAAVVLVERAEDGAAVAVPNILLQQPWPIRAYCVCSNGLTRACYVFDVEPRQKPDDYVYTETEIKTWEALDERVRWLEEHGGGGGGIVDIPFSDDMPRMNGAGSPGESEEVSRADHVHPTDTSRMEAAANMAVIKDSDLQAGDAFIVYDVPENVMKRLTWDYLSKLIKNTLNGRIDSVGVVDDISGCRAILPELEDDAVLALAGDIARALTDYYKKAETYTRSEVDTKIGAVADSAQPKGDYALTSDLSEHNTSAGAHTDIRRLIDALNIAIGNAQPKGDYALASDLPEHNTSTEAHSDIRLLFEGLDSRLTALADSDDDTLDQLSEIVEYIKDNRELIESVTTAKVSVSDIVNDLVTNVANKPLAAAQGVAIKALLDALAANKLDTITFTTELLKYYTRTQVDNIIAGLQPKGDYALRSELPSVPVKSVNGKTGAVELTPDDIGAQPKGNYALASDIPSVPVKSVNGKTGAVQLVPSDIGAQPAGDYAYRSELPSVPVQSVNGKTGAVHLKAFDVGAAPSDKTITITGVDESGTTHTWTVYGVKV